MPSGPTTTNFLRKHEKTMYPTELADHTIIVSDTYLPLVLHWALNTLSALKFLHSKGILYGMIHIDCCWLSSDLSMLFVGFLYARFRDEERDELYVGSLYDQSIKSDLFGWMCLFNRLLTGTHQYEWIEMKGPDFENNITPDVPSAVTDLLGDVVRKCWALEYESSQELWTDLGAALKNKGYEVGDAGLKDFDPTTILRSEM
jgi:serine/threonine protein kinase